MTREKCVSFPPVGEFYCRGIAEGNNHPRLLQPYVHISSLFDEFHSFHSRFKIAHACQKRPNLHTNELNTTFFCSTSPLKAPIRLKPLKLA
jgi:hypothetical protein